MYCDVRTWWHFHGYPWWPAGDILVAETLIYGYIEKTKNKETSQN
jgi:hypothetical protein